MAEAILDAKNMAHHITLTVKFQRMRQWRWRCWLGVQLIRLAALIMWVNLDIDMED